ncbi:MAG: hypothetical protein IRY99_21065 [Isosphaeraceae bacterium]|nr:hypothetical protein [Isosphaeraceae bacterium]
MAEMSSGAALRQLQQAQAGMRKARQALRLVRSGEGDPQAILKVGWESLVRAHRLLSEIPLSAATDPVLTKQLSVQRYATALLVRLRRLVRNEPGALEGLEEDFEDEEP